MEALHRDFLLENDIKVPPGQANGSSNYTVGEDSFDNNMVIILAALLCALICALGLNSIVRCALRCSQTPEQSTARLASKGLKKETLTRIPVVVYGTAAGMTATDCPICLGEFKEGQKVRIMPKCSHGFHVKCIDTWLRSHSSCPICRQLLFEPSSVTCADVDHVV